jgi:hypothetical protein
MTLDTIGAGLDGLQFREELNDTIIEANNEINNLSNSSNGVSITVEAKHFVGAEGEPAFQNGYGNTNDVGYAGLNFWKDPFGVVHLEGLINCGSTMHAIFILPTSYRPSTNKILNVQSDSGIAQLLISTDGTVMTNAANGVQEMTFDGITFEATNNATVILAPLVLEPRNYVGTTDQPAFQNGWVNYGSGFANVAYYKNSDGLVFLEGMVKSGANSTTVFTLPTGYIPSNNMLFNSYSGTHSFVNDQIEIDTSGNVSVSTSDTGAVSLNIPPFRI